MKKERLFPVFVGRKAIIFPGEKKKDRKRRCIVDVIKFPIFWCPKITIKLIKTFFVGARNAYNLLGGSTISKILFHKREEFRRAVCISEIHLSGNPLLDIGIREPGLKKLFCL